MPVQSDSNDQALGQAICQLIPDAGGSLLSEHSGCRWQKLANCPLLSGEVVELSAQSFAGNAQRAQLVDAQIRHFRKLQNGHIFADTREFNPCPNGGSAGRRMRVYHRSHVEHYGYAQCGEKLMTLRVYLLKNGGTDPSALFDDLANRAGELRQRPARGEHAPRFSRVI